MDNVIELGKLDIYDSREYTQLLYATAQLAAARALIDKLMQERNELLYCNRQYEAALRIAEERGGRWIKGLG